jgi:hypothetical protein
MLCVLRVLLGATATVTSFPFPSTLGEVCYTRLLWPACLLQFTWEVSLLPSPLGLSSHRHFYKLSCSKVAGRVLPLLPSPAGLFIYSSVRDFLSPTLQPSGRPTLFATCLLLLLFIQFGFFFSFFPGWGSVCPGGYADLAQHCLWGYHVPLSSPGGLLLSSW